MNPQDQQAPSKDVEAYQRLGIAAMKIIYDANVSKGLIQMMQGQEPAQGVAMAASTVIEKLKEQVQGINPGFVYSVAPAVITFLCELGGAAGLFKPDSQLVQQATEVLQGQLKSQATPQPGQPQQAAAQPQQPAAPAGLIAQGA